MKTVDLVVMSWREALKRNLATSPYQPCLLCPNHTRWRPLAKVIVGARGYCVPCAARLKAPALAR